MRFGQTLVLVAVVLLVLSAPAARAGITGIVESGGDAGRFSIIEPETDGTAPEGTLFGEDAWTFTDRTHEYNGAAFDANGGLTTGAGTDPAIATTIGLPPYLVGQPYIANANNHRDNAAYRLQVTVDKPSYLYLLIDNRLGDSNNKNPATLGSGGVGLMAWVADDGFVQMKTGISPNDQADYGAVDEGGSLSTPINVNNRAHFPSANLGVGQGVALNQFWTVFRKEIPAGTIELKEQNGGGLNMYGVVVAPVPEPSTLAMLAASGLLGLFMWKRRRAA